MSRIGKSQKHELVSLVESDEEIDARYSTRREADNYTKKKLGNAKKVGVKRGYYKGIGKQDSDTETDSDEELYVGAKMPSQPKPKNKLVDSDIKELKQILVEALKDDARLVKSKNPITEADPIVSELRYAFNTISKNVMDIEVSDAGAIAKAVARGTENLNLSLQTELDQSKLTRIIERAIEDNAETDNREMTRAITNAIKQCIIDAYKTPEQATKDILSDISNGTQNVNDYPEARVAAIIADEAEVTDKNIIDETEKAIEQAVDTLKPPLSLNATTLKMRTALQNMVTNAKAKAKIVTALDTLAKKQGVAKNIVKFSSNMKQRANERIERKRAATKEELAIIKENASELFKEIKEAANSTTKRQLSQSLSLPSSMSLSSAVFHMSRQLSLQPGVDVHEDAEIVNLLNKQLTKEIQKAGKGDLPLVQVLKSLIKAIDNFESGKEDPALQTLKDAFSDIVTNAKTQPELTKADFVGSLMEAVEKIEEAPPAMLVQPATISSKPSPDIQNFADVVAQGIYDLTKKSASHDASVDRITDGVLNFLFVEGNTKLKSDEVIEPVVKNAVVEALDSLNDKERKNPASVTTVLNEALLKVAADEQLDQTSKRTFKRIASVMLNGANDMAPGISKQEIGTVVSNNMQRVLQKSKSSGLEFTAGTSEENVKGCWPFWSAHNHHHHHHKPSPGRRRVPHRW